MSLVLTKVQDLRVASPQLDKFTNRQGRYGAFNKFRKDTNAPNSIISQELAQRAMRAVGIDTKVPVFDTKSVTLGSARSVTIADDENTSQFYTVTWETVSYGFTMTPAMYLNNEHGYAADFNKKFMPFVYAMGDFMEAKCIAALEAGKSQVFGDLLGYTNTANVITASQAQKNRLIGDASVLQNANDYYSMFYDVIANAGMQSHINQLYKEADFQATNEALQLQDKELHYTNALANGAGVEATAFIVNEGSTGLLFRHEREAILGTRMPNGTEWGTIEMPVLGIPMDTFYRIDAGDQSAIGGTSTADLTRGVKESFGFAIDVATVVAYNTDLTANASPIIKVAITTA